MKEGSEVRPPAAAGTFYPADPIELRETVLSMLETKDSPKDEDPAGVIAPHAGYMYSGPTAGAAYASLRTRHYETVVIVAPSHREAFRGITVFGGRAYSTPLGEVVVNAQRREQLVHELPIARISSAGHRAEHALEVQLPFLQVVMEGFTLLPIVMGEQSRDTVISLGSALGQAFGGERVLLIASTDLSHYYPADIAEKIDRVSIEDIRAFNPEGLMEHLEENIAEACGGGPTVAVMTALRILGADRVEIAHHCTSGDVTGDRRSVVGYCSAIAWKKRAA